MSLFMLAAYGFACAAVYHLCPAKIRWVVLLLASYGFYASRSLAGLPFILVTTGTTWLAALAIARIGESGKARLNAAEKERKKAIRAAARRRQRAVMLAALLLNFGLLAVLKYTDDVRGWFGASPLGLLLPLGISFYTFQSMGYLLDVYNGKYAPQKNLARFALFVSFFPQLIQGPIGRYDQLEKQLEDGGRVDVPRAFLLMLWGLAKKMIVADRALPMVSAVFDAPGGTWGGAMAVVGVLAYSVQQYCDFSGGIDLVAGIAELFGIRLAENFRRPYFAVSLGDFWRRWHISLGAWMRDYVFYPFALSRPVSRLSKAAKGRFGASFARALPAALGNILVFTLVGVWHGATSNYILWGLYNGVILAVTALLEMRYKRLNERCATAGDAVRMMGGVFARPEWAQVRLDNLGISPLDARILAVGVLLLAAVSLLGENGKDVRGWLASRALPIRWAAMLAGTIAVLLLGVWGSGFSEASFIYFNF